MTFISNFLSTTWNSLVEMGSMIVWPLLFFVAVAIILKKKEAITDLRRAFPQSLLNFKILLFNLIFVVPGILLVSQWVNDAAVALNLRIIQPDTWSGMNQYLVLFVAIFIGDFVGYWRHRLEHTPILWPSHAVHHSDDEMTWLTLIRFHPLNRLTTIVIDSLALVLLGLPPYAIIVNNWVRHYYGYFIHADLPWTYGKASWIFVSPAMHRWHHAADSRFFQTNFATVFSVFDRAFGTYRVPGPCDAPLGVTDTIEPTLKGQFLYMFEPRAYKSIIRGNASFWRWKTERKADNTKERAVEQQGL